ncbi:MAG: transglycosylase domain-containing protein [Bacteroidaceae bacterium]
MGNSKKGFSNLLKTIFSKIRGACRWYKNLYKGARWYKKTLIGFVSFILFIFVFLFAVNINLFWLFGKSPSIHSIMHPENSEASMIYSADSVLIGKYFNQNRSPVTYEEINPVFFKALIDTEDERFYEHNGIDFQGLFAAVKDMMSGHARGASTITQQLVKNMFRVRTQYSTGLLGVIPGVKMLIMKSKEWILAVELEMLYDKKEILTMYANTVDFGSNAYGIKTAAKTYFNTTPLELSTEQASVLVGLLKATSTYNPKINPKNSLKRRNIVINNLYTHKHLTKHERDSILEIPILLNFSIENAYDGKALYFRQAVAASLKDWCKENSVDLYTDGLKIYTTLDTRMQKYAEEAVNKQMRVIQRNFKNHWGSTDPWQDENHKEIPNFIENLAKKTDTYKTLEAKYPNNSDSVHFYMNKPHKVKLFDYNGFKEDVMSTMDSIRYMVKFMHTGFVAMEPNTGYVKAWVGDIDFGTWKYDKVTSMRQPGSTFKLFVYSEAMNQGLTPSDRRRDSYIQMEVPNKEGKLDTWRPHNANGYFTNDSLSLKAAFAQSVNSIAVKLGNELGISNVARTAKAMGVESPLDATPSLSLGSSDVNLLELINAYCTAVNDGKKHEPVLVTKIVDRKGNVIYTAPTEEVQAIPYRSAFYMQQLLMGGMKERGGTSMALWGYINPYARSTDFGGKTGTSSNHSDAWFVGITPGLVGGAWVGGEYRCIHFRTGALGQGSRTALPIFGYFMQSVLKDPNFKKYKRKFAPCKEDIDPSTYNCPSYVTEKVKVDTLLTDSLATADEEIIDETIKPKVKESDEIKFDEIVGEDNKKKVTP